MTIDSTGRAHKPAGSPASTGGQFAAQAAPAAAAALAEGQALIERGAAMRREHAVGEIRAALGAVPAVKVSTTDYGDSLSIDLWDADGKRIEDHDDIDDVTERVSDILWDTIGTDGPEWRTSREDEDRDVDYWLDLDTPQASDRTNAAEASEDTSEGHTFLIGDVIEVDYDGEGEYVAWHGGAEVARLTGFTGTISEARSELQRRLDNVCFGPASR